MLSIKKLFLTLSALAVVGGSIYPKTVVVLDADNAVDIVTCEDCNGYLWEFEGAEDWQAGDMASMIMFNMGTKDITDDIILSVKYEGGAECFLR